MTTTSSAVFKKVFCTFFIAAVIAATFVGARAASLSPNLVSRISGIADAADVGMVIVAFKTTNGLQDNHLNILRNIGITGGYTYPTLGMVAQPMPGMQPEAPPGPAFPDGPPGMAPGSTCCRC